MHESSKCKLFTVRERKSFSDFSEKSDSDSPRQQRSEQIKNSFWLPLEECLLIFALVQYCFKPTQRLMADQGEDVIMLFPFKVLPPLFQRCRAKWEMDWQWKPDPLSLSRVQPSPGSELGIRASITLRMKWSLYRSFLGSVPMQFSKPQE